NWEVGVQGETIVVVAEPGTLTQDAARVIDAGGKIVVPGGVEPHTHCSWLIPTAAESGLYTGGIEEVSKACLFGGTTTLVDFAYWEPGQNLFQTLEEKEKLFKGNSYADYSYHCALFSTKGDLPFEVIGQIKEVIGAGYPSFKVWTTNTTPTRPRQMTDIGHLAEIMGHVATNNGIMAIHAEDEDIVMFMYKKLKHEGRTQRRNMHLVHSNMSEDIAFRRVIRLAEWMGSAIYLMHVSAREGVAAIAEARSKDLPVYGETLHHYASFTQEDYEAPQGAIYHTYPSLKSEDDTKALWDGLVGGDLSTIATDELFTTKAIKMRGETIEDTTGGSEGVEARMGIAYSEGVVKRGMSLERFVEITSANAARILGLYPRKGAIAPGSDADIALIDPTFDKRLELSDLHGSDYSPWEDWEVKGWPVMTILRGKVVVEGGKLLAEPGLGQLLPRKINPQVLTRPAC
ncbi:MAG: amidohydrolase family protein, partial [Dehalococcoidia bacterium]